MDHYWLWGGSLVNAQPHQSQWRNHCWSRRNAQPFLWAALSVQLLISSDRGWPDLLRTSGCKIPQFIDGDADSYAIRSSSYRTRTTYEFEVTTSMASVSFRNRCRASLYLGCFKLPSAILEIQPKQKHQDNIVKQHGRYSCDHFKNNGRVEEKD